MYIYYWYNFNKSISEIYDIIIVMLKVEFDHHFSYGSTCNTVQIIKTKDMTNTSPSKKLALNYKINILV